MRDIPEAEALAVLGRDMSERVAELEPDLITWRRDLHRHPEPGFGEFRTATLVRERLLSLGLDVRIAEEAMESSSVFHRHEERIAASAQRARDTGISDALLDRMLRHGTAVVADLRRGDGPTVAFRFDMDCLPVNEATATTHLPTREGFRSLVDGEMHACGHDGHVTIGLGIASVLANVPGWAGTVRLIFQPAEEGALGGARAIVAKGLVDDVDYLIATHLGLGVKSGEFVGSARFLATSKYRADFQGRGAHVTNSPQAGRNALLAAASAALALHAMAPHSDGWYSLNVGVMHAGDEQGVTPPWATLEFGLWADTKAVHDYVVERAFETIAGAGAAWGVETELTQIGGAPTADGDRELARLACAVAAETPGTVSVTEATTCRAGEDATELIKQVADHGGKGTYVLVGSDLAAGHHASDFDFDERSITRGTSILCALAVALLRSEP